jgi:hypothetical protein
MSQLVDEMKVSPPWDRLARVLRERCPDFRSAVLFGSGAKPQRFLRVILPLSSNGHDVDCLLSAYVFSPYEPQHRNASRRAGTPPSAGGAVKRSFTNLW